jgi:acetyltransferase-like isoleucine patch superfamily enzyme
LGDPSQDRIVKLSGKNIKIGAYTYGLEDIKLLSWGEDISISFGRYCSIASGLIIYCGGNHRVDWFSTFPFGHVYAERFNLKPIPETPVTNGDIIIGNDVWIGRDVSILSGVVIGDGAIIAANSHVVKDVSPYSIVGGNPAKLIRFRFDEEIIQRLHNLEWWGYENIQIEKLVPYLCFQVYDDPIKNIEKLEEILKTFNYS